MVEENAGKDDRELGEKMNQLITSCADSTKVGGDPCESAVEYMKCGVAKAKSVRAAINY